MKTDTVTVVNSKPETQKQIKALRDAGLIVVKDSGGMYSCDFEQKGMRDGKPTGNTKTIRLFTAMPGRRGYLIRRQANLFS